METLLAYTGCSSIVAAGTERFHQSSQVMYISLTYNFTKLTLSLVVYKVLAGYVKESIQTASAPSGSAKVNMGGTHTPVLNIH